jgi:hypothetical protein
MHKKIKFARWVLDFLFCLYGSALYVSNRYASSDRLLNKIFDTLVALDKFFFARFHVSPFGAGGTDPQLFNSEWLVMTLLTFACIRLLGQVGLVERFIPFVGVCLTVAGQLYGSFAASEWYMSPRVWLMRFEVTVVVAILLRYAHRTSTASTSLCLGVVVAHFWLWGWIIKAPDTGYTWLMMAVWVLLPFGTILLWGVYSRTMTSSVVADRAIVNSR